MGEARCLEKVGVPKRGRVRQGAGKWPQKEGGAKRWDGLTFKRLGYNSEVYRSRLGRDLNLRKDQVLQAWGGVRTLWLNFSLITVG